MTDESSISRKGLAQALGAHGIWGLVPLYFLLVIHVPALELVAWRAIFTLPVCLLLLGFAGQFGQLWRAISNRRTLGWLAVSAALIGTNWVVIVLAVQAQHVLATSLGYYINPMFNVLMGTVFLKERLSRLQWLAVGLALAGIMVLVWGALDTLWISLTLALCFSTYGLVRKLVPVESLPGLAIETALWLLPAIAVVVWFAASPEGSSIAGRPLDFFNLAIGGPITAAPLLLFAAAARRLDYSLLGFTQFLAPTVTFILSLTVFGEHMRPAQGICFAFIWTAIALYVWDLLRRRRRPKPVAFN